jgi:hypothetical protein
MLAQPEKLGPLLEKKFPGWRVWPASAGSWSIANETVYLDRHPAVQKEADALVWVLNTGDLDAPSKWSSEETHPRRRPASALGFVFQKFVLPRIWKPAPSSAEPAKPVQILPATETALREHYGQLRAAHPDRKILFVIYPQQIELQPAAPADEALYEKFRDRVRANTGPEADIVEVRDDPRWKRELYRDGIHPTAQGNAVLAEIIAGHLTLPKPAGGQ